MNDKLTKNEEIALEALERIAEESKAEGSLPCASNCYVAQYCFENGKTERSLDVGEALYSLFLNGKAIRLTLEKGGDELNDAPVVLWALASVLDH